MTRITKVLLFALLSAVFSGRFTTAEPVTTEPLVEAWRLIESAKLQTSQAAALDSHRRAKAILTHFVTTRPNDVAAKGIVGGATVGGLSLDDLGREVERNSRRRATICADSPAWPTFDCSMEASKEQRIRMKEASERACDVPSTSDGSNNSCRYFRGSEAGFYKDKRWRGLQLEALVAVGDLEMAIRTWEENKEAFDPSTKHHLLVVIAEGLGEAGFRELSGAYFDAAREFAVDRFSNDRTRQSRALLRVAEARVRVGMLAEARRTISEALGDQLISGRNRSAYAELVEIRIAAIMVEGGDLDKAGDLLRQVGNRRAVSSSNRSVLVETYTQYGMAEAARGNTTGALNAFKQATSVAGDGNPDWSAMGKELYDCRGGCTVGPRDRAREAVNDLISIALGQHAAGLRSEAAMTLANAEIAAGELSDELSGALPDALAEVAAARTRVQGAAAGRQALEKAEAAWKNNWSSRVWEIFMADGRSGPRCSYDSDWFRRKRSHHDFVQAHISLVKPTCDRAFAAALHALGDDPMPALSCDGSEMFDRAQQVAWSAMVGAEEAAAGSQAGSGGGVTTDTQHGKDTPASTYEAYLKSREEAEKAEAQRQMQKARDWEVAKFAEKLAREREWSAAVQMTRHISDANDRAQALISIAELQSKYGSQAGMKATLSEAVATVATIPDWEEIPDSLFHSINEHERNTALDRALRLSEIARVLGRDITNHSRRARGR